MVQYNSPSPSSKDPYHIWTNAGLPHVADENQIIEAIDDWTVFNAYVYWKDDQYHIQWVNPQGYIIKTFYDTFRKWILSACTKVENLSLDAPVV
jgi:hypothetical protein